MNTHGVIHSFQHEHVNKTSSQIEIYVHIYHLWRRVNLFLEQLAVLLVLGIDAALLIPHSECVR